MNKYLAAIALLFLSACTHDVPIVCDDKWKQCSDETYAVCQTLITGNLAKADCIIHAIKYCGEKYKMGIYR